MKEELISDKENKIIAKLIQVLAQENPDHYYTDSSTIANLVVEKIQKKENLTNEQYLLVRHFNAKDVLIRMSYHSNCC